MRQAPAYCVHKSRNLAFVRLSGRMVYLGRAHSAESHERYHAALAAHYAGKPVEATARHRRTATAFTVAELAERYYLSERSRRGPSHQCASYGTVARLAGMRREHAAGTTARLERRGLIRVRVRGRTVGQDGKRTANVYELLVPDPFTNSAAIGTIPEDDLCQIDTANSATIGTPSE